MNDSTQDGPFKPTIGRWRNLATAKILAHTGSYDQFGYGRDHPRSKRHQEGEGPDQKALLCCPKSGLIAADIDDEPLFMKSRTAEIIDRSVASTLRGDGFHVLVDCRHLPVETWPRQGSCGGWDIKSNGFVPMPGSTHYSGEEYRAAHPDGKAHLVTGTPELLAAMCADRADHHAKDGAGKAASGGSGTPGAGLIPAVGKKGLNDAYASIKGRMVSGDLFTEDEVAELLRLANRGLPEPMDEARLESTVLRDKGWQEKAEEIAAEIEEIRSPGSAARPASASERRLRGQVEKRKAELRVNQVASAELLAESVPPVPGLTGGTEFLAQQDEDPEFRIHGLWPAGANVICSAQYKSGKTVLVGNLLRSLLDGDKFLGRFAVEAAEGVTAVIDVEMAARLARKWLNEQSIANSAGFAYVNLRGAVASFNMLDARSRAEWAAKLRDAGCTRLVLDCVGPVLAGLGLDENKATDVGRFIVGFEQMMKEAGISESFTVHHMGHDAERARGASRLRDWPDAEWRLVRQDANPNSPRYFSAYGRDVDFSESQLTYDEATRHLKISGQGSRKTVEEDAAIDAVSKLLDDQPGLSGKGCEDALVGDVGQKAVRNALAELVSRGSIDVQKRGNGRYYYPAPAGKLALPEGPG